MSVPKHEEFKELLLDKNLKASQIAKKIGCTVRAVYCLRYKLKNSENLKKSKEKYRKKNHLKILEYQRQYGSAGLELAENLGTAWSSSEEINLYNGTAVEVALEIGRTPTSVYRKRSRNNKNS